MHIQQLIQCNNTFTSWDSFHRIIYKKLPDEATV